MVMSYPVRGTGTRATAFKEFRLAGGEAIGVFQGNRGSQPELDIIVKYADKYTMTKNPRTPKHIHWAIDLLLKKSHQRGLTQEFIKFLISIYDNVPPFANKADQLACTLQFATPARLAPFKPLDANGQYSVEFIAVLIELLSRAEKTGHAGAFMFRGVLVALRDTDDVFAITSAASFS